MSNETETKHRKSIASFYKVKNDATGEETVVKAASASIAEAYSRNEALKKIASFTTTKLDADDIVELSSKGVDLKAVPLIESTASKKKASAAVGAPSAAPEAADAAPADETTPAASPAPVFSTATFGH